jgi:hypothetical protein
LPQLLLSRELHRIGHRHGELWHLGQPLAYL